MDIEFIGNIVATRRIAFWGYDAPHITLRYAAEWLKMHPEYSKVLNITFESNAGTRMTNSRTIRKVHVVYVDVDITK